MALIDLKSNLAYNGETVDNIKNDNQTGFTGGRKQGDETEFVQTTRGVDSQHNENIGGTNTTDGNFQPNQEQNVAGQSELVNKSSLFQGQTGTTLPPEVKGRQQALQAVEGVGIGKSVLFVGKQSVLHKFNADEDTRKYDPTSLVKNLAVATDNIGGGNTKDGSEFANSESEVVNQGIKFDEPSTSLFLGVNRFNDKNKRPSNRISVKMDEEPISYGLKLPTYFGKNNKIPKDFIKFFVRDPQSGRLIQFPAYLTDITDNSSAEYSPTRYIGRADQVYVYSGYTRNISLGFRVAALTRGDVPMMWRKIEALKSMTLPAYEDNVIQNDNELRPVAPFVELTLGNYFAAQPGYFSSVNVTIPQNSTWETEPGYQLTHLADVSLEFTYIGKKLPRLTGKQYDIEYEQEFATEREAKEIVSERLQALKNKEAESKKINFDTKLNTNVSDTYEDTVRRGRRAEESNPLLNIGRV